MRYVHIYNRQKDQLVLWFPGSVVEAFEQKKNNIKQLSLSLICGINCTMCCQGRGVGNQMGKNKLTN